MFAAAASAALAPAATASPTRPDAEGQAAPLDFAFEPLADDVSWETYAEGSAADDVLFAPDLTSLGARTAQSNAHGRARTPIPIDIIRKGFPARRTITGAMPERSVGLRLGADVFSVSTTLVAPPGYAGAGTARLDWKLARPIENAGPGFIWTISTGGAAGISAHPEQNANFLVGFRHRLFEHLTLTSQLSMTGNYVFATGNGLHSAVTPEVKLTADLAALADLRWAASLDVALGRQMPLVASDFETRGTAMLRLKYTLD